MLIDSHTHYFKKNFDCGREEILEQLKVSDIKVIETAIGLDSNEEVLQLCQKHLDIMRAVLGCHPNCVSEMSEAGWSYLAEKICNTQQVVGIGETGLDYVRAKQEERKIQKLWFGRFIEMSKQLDKPLVIHCRGEEAYAELYEVLYNHGIREKAGCPGVIHCFSGSRDDIQKLTDMGFYLGVGGLFLKENELQKVIQCIPLERVVLETDSPYLSPVGLPGKRNTSLNLPYIMEKLSELWQVDVERIRMESNKNIHTIFGVW